MDIRLVLTQTSGQLAQMYQQAEQEYLTLVKTLNARASVFTLPRGHVGPVIPYNPDRVRYALKVGRHLRKGNFTVYDAARLIARNPAKL